MLESNGLRKLTVLTCSKHRESNLQYRLFGEVGSPHSSQKLRSGGAPCTQPLSAKATFPSFNNRAGFVLMSFLTTGR